MVDISNINDHYTRQSHKLCDKWILQIINIVLNDVSKFRINHVF